MPFFKWTNRDGYSFPLCETCKILRKGPSGMPGTASPWPHTEAATCNDCGLTIMAASEAASELSRLSADLEYVTAGLVKALREDDTANRSHYMRLLAKLQVEILRLEEAFV